jgi:tol-pal system-associated acyl-CoA thioesterase
MQKKIYYHDTDSGGVVYYANYLKFLEEARTEAMREVGLEIKALAQQGILFVVRRQEIDYKAPALYGDILDVQTWVSSISAAQLTFEARIKNQDGQLVSTAKTLLVCVDSHLKPQAIPQELKDKLSRLQKPE